MHTAPDFGRVSARLGEWFRRLERAYATRISPMRLKQTLTAVMLAVAATTSMASGPVIGQAYEYQSGGLAPDSAGFAYLGNAAPDIGIGDFAMTWTLEARDAVLTSVSVIDVTASIQAGGPSVFVPSDQYSFDGVGTTDGIVLSFNKLLSGHDYMLKVGLTANTPYSLFLTYNYPAGAVPPSTPVPEPETYGLALAGLLVAGAALRRRQAASA
jgi:PEP-CTERM motif